MNSLSGGAVAAFCMCGSSVHCATGGIVSGTALFLGGSAVEDLSKKVAGYVSSDSESSLFATANSIFSIAINTLLVYAFANAAASALIGIVAFPLPAAGAFFAAVAYEVCSVAKEKVFQKGVESPPRSLNSSPVNTLPPQYGKGRLVGALSQDGKSVWTGERSAVALLDEKGETLRLGFLQTDKDRSIWMFDQSAWNSPYRSVEVIVDMGQVYLKERIN